MHGVTNVIEVQPAAAQSTSRCTARCDRHRRWLCRARPRRRRWSKPACACSSSRRVPHLGGRATAYRDPQTGERIDNGQHVLAGCYDETLRFLRRIGRARSLRRPSTLRVAMIDEDGRRLELRLPPLPAPLHLLGGVLAWSDLTWRERVAVLRVGPALRRVWRNGAAAAASSAKPCGSGWTRHQQPPRLCRLFWEPLALATLNQSIDHAAAGPFLTVLARMFGSGRRRGDAAPAGDAARRALRGAVARRSWPAADRVCCDRPAGAHRRRRRSREGRHGRVASCLPRRS